MQVKSAVRVFEVLEYFDGVQREASLSEIAGKLGYPMSSTSMLLQCMVDRGYLVQKERGPYRPTPRVTMLGAWVSPMLDARGAVVAMMEWLGAQCGQTVVLAVPERMQVRYLRVVAATGTVRMHVNTGDVRPFPHSGFGRLFMSRMPDSELIRVVNTHNAQQADDAQQLHLPAVRRDMAGIRAAGYSVSFDRVSPGAGVVAVPLPTPVGEAPMAVGIGAPSALIKSRSSALNDLLQTGLQKYFESESHE